MEEDDNAPDVLVSLSVFTIGWLISRCGGVGWYLNEKQGSPLLDSTGFCEAVAAARSNLDVCFAFCAFGCWGAC